MGHAGRVVVALRVNEDLALVLESPETVGVDDAIAVSLECGAYRGGFFFAVAGSVGGF